MGEGIYTVTLPLRETFSSAALVSSAEVSDSFLSAEVVVVCSAFLEVSAAGAFPLFEHAAKLRHITPAVIAEIIRLFFILFVEVTFIQNVIISD